MTDDTRSGGEANGPRQPYVKPQIQEVPLRPEEAVLGACKTAGRSGPAQFRCTVPSSCSSPLS
jgi:hypothetical protein